MQLDSDSGVFVFIFVNQRHSLLYARVWDYHNIMRTPVTIDPDSEVIKWVVSEFIHRSLINQPLLSMPLGYTAL